ncbi:MAG TPA: class I SAM-dependent methyltransferase [Anaerolineae bacterium]|nr:class I SAM-dependent methyltransferase [Anaerolineae bacterium]
MSALKNQPIKTNKAEEWTLRLLDDLFGKEGGEKVRVRLWNNEYWLDDSPKPATIVLNHPGALRSMFLPGTEVGLAEAYLYDDFDIKGDIESVFDLAEILSNKVSNTHKKLSIAADVLHLPKIENPHPTNRKPAHLSGKRHSIERDQKAIAYHYNVSNDFYALWLDDRMIYSCAYFHSPEEDLNTAQERKLDYLCKKLRLKPGQRLLDLGCGWGGLVIHAAKNYGVDATGITTSQPQVELANERIRTAGLSDHCRVILKDYRQVDDFEKYDALASVGMFEHVGADLLPVYFEQAYKLLKPGGVFLNHGIAKRENDERLHRPTFSEVYVFPDGELTPINVSLHAAEISGFEVRDVESLREHYAITLRKWVQRLEANHSQALNYVDEPTYRVWRLFMSGSAHGFANGRLNVYQSLLLKPLENGKSGYPLTRKDWYEY